MVGAQFFPRKSPGNSFSRNCDRRARERGGIEGHFLLSPPWSRFEVEELVLANPQGSSRLGRS